jgi:multiple sugar transport system substrate-binding protein/putative aldouronate transport system substrate-binding protein
MKKGRVVSSMLAAMLSLSVVLAGCSSDSSTTTSKETSKETTTETTTETATDSTTTPKGDAGDEMTIDVYSVAANYQGEQAGWFAKVLKDKFNVKLNIIAPQASGDGKALYQTRCAAGNLGDIIILDNSDFQDCVKAGLIADITQDLDKTTNLKTYSEQIKTYNGNLEGNDGKLYGIPCNMTNTSPTTYTDIRLYSSPMLPWDYYSELGCPEMKNLEDLLDTMEKVQKAHPTNAAGDAAYALSLWADWDNTSIETVNQLTKWYGYEVNGSVLLGNKGDMKELTDEAGAYYKMLHFFYEANQRGLIDPDSGTQDWETACTKMKNKQVLLMWYNWQLGFYNTIERGNNKDSYIYAPVSDMNFYQAGDTYYGEIRSWSLGSQVDATKKAKIMEVLDWLAGPEGATCLHDGLEGFNYTVGDNGKYILTKDGENALMANLEVPEEFGGGGYNDGMCKINQWIAAATSTNTVTGDPYGNDKWSSYIEANKTTMTKEWAAKYGAENQVEYLKKTGQLEIVPNVNIVLPSDSTDIALIRGQCGQLICDTSWQMIFAGSEDEFKSMWANMKDQLAGLGWKDLVTFDMQKYQKIVDARKAATK